LTYKVWLHIEEINAEADSYRDLDTPGGAIAEFGTNGQARAFVDSLNRLAETFARSSTRTSADGDYEPTRPVQLVGSSWSTKGDDHEV
jgi:hypothetical protein